MSEIPRREFLAAAGGSLAAAWVLADPAHLKATAEWVVALGNRRVRYEFLTADQAAVLDAATAQILPSDDTPGAREARVVNFMDRSLATWAKDQRPAMTKVVKDLDARARKVDATAKSFAALSAERQRDVIAWLEKEKPDSFNALRGATIVGTLSNPEYGGNFEKNGWKMLGFVDRFSWSAPFGHYDR